jgi:hypothetical protein
MADREKIQQALDRFIKHVTSRAKANLTNKDSNVSKKLYNSIKGEYKVMPNSIGLYFTMEEYGQYQDQGVKGKKSSAKAPKSPFKFGSGTGKKGGLTQEIQKWVEKRRFQFKDERGKFMSYKSTAWVITKSIYAKGLKPTMFFTKPFQEAYKNLPEEIAKEYGLEVNELFKISLKK